MAAPSYVGAIEIATSNARAHWAGMAEVEAVLTHTAWLVAAPASVTAVIGNERVCIPTATSTTFRVAGLRNATGASEAHFIPSLSIKAKEGESKMSIPGFTSDSSLGRTEEIFKGAVFTGGGDNSGLQPAFCIGNTCCTCTDYGCMCQPKHGHVLM